MSPTHGSWQAVYIAPNETVGSRVKDALTRRGFLVMLRCGGTSGPGGSAACEVLVPALEAEEAHQAVTDLRRGVGGAGK